MAKKTQQSGGPQDAELNAKLARLAELEERFATALEHAKLDAMKELAYGASHEINNPLANISTRAQTLLKGETDPERRRMLAAIHQQAMRAHEMIADLMLFARPPQLVRSRCDLGALCEQVVAELNDRAITQQLNLNFARPAEAILVNADETQLGMALRSVCMNAIEWTPPGGSVTMQLTPKSEHVEIEVRDTGLGIPADVRPHIFEPFYSGREAGRGLGFGLSKCWRIVSGHGGSISVDAAQPHGTLVRICLANAEQLPV